MSDSENTRLILLFDGICNYCNKWVNIVIKHDKKKKFKFAALQSEAGKKLLRLHSLPEDNISSFVLIENPGENGAGGKAYLKSTAGLIMLKHLGGMRSLAYAFIIVPRFIRDFVYNIIARSRYKWWGKRESCMIPTEDVKARFL